MLPDYRLTIVVCFMYEIEQGHSPTLKRLEILSTWLFFRLAQVYMVHNENKSLAWNYITENEDSISERARECFAAILMKPYGLEYSECSFLRAKTKAQKTKLKAFCNLLDKIPNVDKDSWSHDAFEYLLQKRHRGEKMVLGEYYTPRELTHCIAALVEQKITVGSTVFDPFSGSGGMLTSVFFKLKEKYLREKSTKVLKEKTFFGIEINPQMALIAKLSFILIGDGASKIEAKDAFEDYKDGCEKSGIYQGRKHDFVVTNIPFIKRRTFSFLSLCLDATKPGGTVIAIVPENFLSSRAKSVQREREKLMDKSTITLCVRLNSGTFTYTKAKSYLLVLHVPPKMKQMQHESDVWYFDWKLEKNKIDKDSERILFHHLANFHSIEGKNKSLNNLDFRKAPFSAEEGLSTLKTCNTSPVQHLRYLRDKESKYFNIADLVKNGIIEIKYGGKRSEEEEGKYQVFGCGAKPQKWRYTESNCFGNGTIRIATTGFVGHGQGVFYHSKAFWATRDAILVRSKNETLLATKFLFVALKRIKFDDHARGTVQTYFNMDDLKMANLKLPNLQEQKRQIAEHENIFGAIS